MIKNILFWVNMPYPPGHRGEVKDRIVQSARTLFNQFGFDSVSVDRIMAHAGLTRGGFYTYFKSKSELYSEVLQCFFTDPNWNSRWEGVDVDMSASDAGPQIVRAYLSRQHFEDVGNSCPMVALPSDVARAGKTAKAAFENVFQAMTGVLQCGSPSRTRAQAIAALCIGGMVVARALDDRALADELRQAAMTVALELGGWEQAANCDMVAACDSRASA
jgi:TetR/AcrR family transcriptional repressor of nem operon